MKFFAIKIIALMFLLPYLSWAQDNASPFSVNLSGGSTYFDGDVKGQWSYVGKGAVKYNVTRELGIEGAFRYGKLTGENDINDRKFENQFLQYGLSGVLNFSRLTSLNEVCPRIAIFAKGGVHQIHSQAEDLTTYDGNQEPAQDYEGRDIVFPVGGEIKYKLNERLDIGIGFDYTLTNTDRLDNLVQLSSRGRFNDGYSTVTAGLTIKFGENPGNHPDWVQEEENNDEIEALKQEYRQKFRVMSRQIRKLKDEKVDSSQVADLTQRVDTLQTQVDSLASTMAKDTASTEDKDAWLSNKRFVTVLASYKSYNQAERFAKKIEEQGYNPGILYNYYQGWYYVHVNQDDNYQDAMEAQEKVMEDLDIYDAWIYFRSADDLEKYRK